MGATLEASPGERPPFTIEGAELRGIDYVSDVASALGAGLSYPLRNASTMRA